MATLRPLLPLLIQLLLVSPCLLISMGLLARVSATNNIGFSSTSVGVRLPERVLFYGVAQFQGINVPTEPPPVPAPAARQAASTTSMIRMTGTQNSAVGNIQNLTVAPGAPKVGFNGINAVQGRFSGVGPIFTNNNFGSSAQEGGLCVGNGFVVQTMDYAIAVYDTAGNLRAGILALNQFLGLRPIIVRGPNATFGDNAQGPVCEYDKDTKRFFLAVEFEGDGDLSALRIFGQVRVGEKGGNFGAGTIVAVSSAKDPTLPWNVYFIPGTNDGLNSNNDTAPPLNYAGPAFEMTDTLISVDAYGVYISTNQYGSSRDSFFGSNIYALSKKSLIDGVFVFPATRFALPYLNNSVASPLFDQAKFIRPVRVAKDTWYETGYGGVTYFVSMPSFSNTSQSAVAFWVLSNTASLATNFPDLRLEAAPVRTPEWIFFGAPSVVQKDGPIPHGASLNVTTVSEIDVQYGAAIIHSALLQCGKVSFTFGVGLRAGLGVAYGVVRPALGSPRSSERRVLASVNLERFQQFGVPGQSLLFPSIGTNSNSKSLISFALVGPDYFPSAAYVLVNSKGQLVNSKGQLDSKAYIAAQGVAPLDNFDCYNDDPGVCVFYNKIGADVDDKGRAWGAVEYVSGARGTRVPLNWATFIYGVDL